MNLFTSTKPMGILKEYLKQGCQVQKIARSKKIKKAKFGHKQFQKRPNPQKLKRPNCNHDLKIVPKGRKFLSRP